MSDDIAALRQQLQQLAKLHADGTLGDEAYRESRATLERRLVDAVMSGSGAPATPAGPRRHVRMLGGLATLVVVLAAAGYWWSSSTVNGGDRALPSERSGDAAAPAAAPVVEAGSARIGGTVALAPALVAKASPDDVVFIFARAAGSNGMPLAVLRRQVKDLPLDFTLDDSLAMVPASKLSNVSQAVVTARISKTGDAIPQPGDLSGQSAAVPVGTQGLRIVIDSVVGH